MHQPNKKGTKAWYRCVKYESNQCRATAVLHISSKTLLKVTRSHTHSPGFLQEFARLDIRIYLQVYIHWSALWIRIRIKEAKKTRGSESSTMFFCLFKF